jgi:hypothetical protein
MSQEQVGATVALVKYLCATHNIPLVFKGDDDPFASADDALGFNGIFYHTNVRKDKFDWPFSPSLTAVIEACKEPEPEPEPAPEPELKPRPEPVAEKVQEKPAVVETSRPSKANWLTRLLETLANLFKKH